MRGDQKDLARGPGRPRWSGKYRDKCDVRLNKEESAMLDHLSELNDVSRSTIMRKALRDFYLFNNEGGHQDK